MSYFKHDWIICTLCKGSGVITSRFIDQLTTTCISCKGTKIISSQTGKPPVNFDKDNN